MKHLKSISIVFLLFLSCKIQPPSTSIEVPEPFILRAEKSLLYRASFDYKDYHFSGLCVFKKENNSVVRVVFLSEMGITLMDFEVLPENLIVHKIPDPLNKKILLGAFEKDFRQILMTDLFDPQKIRFRNNQEVVAKDRLKASYFLEKESGHVVRSERKGVLGIKSATVSYEYKNSVVPTQINLAHHQVKMNLKLTLLEKM